MNLQAVVTGISWTPLGAAWAVPGDLAAGAWLTGAVKFVIAVATLAVLWVLCSRSLGQKTTGKGSNGSTTRGNPP